MLQPVPYCGIAPLPGALVERFNLDPWLIAALLGLFAWQCASARRPVDRYFALGGWGIAAAAFLSPLCALSVALFSARVGQHMILILAAAPLIAMGLPARTPRPRDGGTTHQAGTIRLWASAVVFFVALWAWHMPVPYEATFASVGVYWAMHVTLFGSGIVLWRELLHHSPQNTAAALAVGSVTFVHMGLLGAVLAFADHPMFAWHFYTTQVWGFTPLEDQQLGGIFMWVPGTALFLWTAIRSIARLWRSLERARPA